MKNKLLAVALCVCLTGSLLGCGGQPASSGDPSESGSETGVGSDGETAGGSDGETGGGSEDLTGSGADDGTGSGQAALEPAAEPVVREADYTGIETASNGARVSVHDPSIKVFDGKYYIYGSHMTGATSEDLHVWKYIGNGYTSDNALFEDLFNEELSIFDYSGDYGNGSYAVWAEDVIYNEAMGKYVMYFCTSSTYIKSNLCYATADAPEGPYVYQGELLYSGFTAEDIGQTDVYEYVDQAYAEETYLRGNGQYDNQDWPNCIDPAPFYDADGRLWMTYGSWSGGIFLLELDPQTGLVIHPEADPENEVDPYFGKRLLGGGHQSIEGPYIQYDADTGYYYLYLSFGSLERTGGYQIRVLRSDRPDGEYVDMGGQRPVKGYNNAYYGLKLSGNYYLPSCKYAYMATGGMSTFFDTDGKQYMCYHTRFNNGNEYHEPAVKQIFMNQEGWPVLAPYTTTGETISESGYDSAELAGEYFFINQGMKIDSEIAQPVMIDLNEDGTVTGSVVGTWTVSEGTPYVHITYDGHAYSGVFCAMKDQAGTEVMTFSAVGVNESIWGVKY